MYKTVLKCDAINGDKSFIGISEELKKEKRIAIVLVGEYCISDFENKINCLKNIEVNYEVINLNSMYSLDEHDVNIVLRELVYDREILGIELFLNRLDFFPVGDYLYEIAKKKSLLWVG
ncbi:hypothetical protein P5F12_13380 [Clostridium perfringens]|nr:hypothetical protein [Clostridium perfringens]